MLLHHILLVWTLPPVKRTLRRSFGLNSAGNRFTTSTTALAMPRCLQGVLTSFSSMMVHEFAKNGSGILIQLRNTATTKQINARHSFSRRNRALIAHTGHIFFSNVWRWVWIMPDPRNTFHKVFGLVQRIIAVENLAIAGMQTLQ